MPRQDDRPIGPGRPRILLIVGYLRTGSTLLERLLGQADGITAAGEIRYIWINGFLRNHLCGCGIPFRSCPFWRNVVAEAFGGFDRVDAQRLVGLQRAVDRLWHVPQMILPMRLAGYGRRVGDYALHLERLYRAIQAVSGSSVIVDSSKAPSHAFLLRSIPALEVDVVHLIRDSRAVAHSWRRLKVKPEVHWERRYMPRYGPVRSAFEWFVMNLSCHPLKRGPGLYTRLRYEDLADQPRAALAGVLEAIGQAEQPLDFVRGKTATLRSNHTVSGNPIRFENGPVRVTPDLEWRTSMPVRDARLVTTLTWPLLRAYGYSGDYGAGEGP